jgi:ribosomal protein S18 acetylase RimI-like enzyme
VDAGIPRSPAAQGSPLTIRRLGPADAGDYWRLRLEGLRDHPDAFGSDYEDARQRSPDQVRQEFAVRALGPERLVLGAFDPAAPPKAPALLGTVGCSREAGAKLRHKALIWGMHVARAARGRGVGRELLDTAIATARSWAGVEQLHLTVAAGNEPARRLYQRAGFSVYGVEPRALKLPDRYVDEELMVLAFT